ncbi:MAG TPA: ThuA domain-containing protein [Polyangiaceae bacterium]|nr:ThuA domain-containing protein [Polyangiaceae bacterium]
MLWLVLACTDPTEDTSNLMSGVGGTASTATAGQANGTAGDATGPAAGTTAAGTPNAAQGGAAGTVANAGAAGDDTANAGAGGASGGAGGVAAAGSAGTSANAGAGGAPLQQGPYQVLAFTKTTGFRHDSIDEGVALLQSLGAANDFTVTQTEDGADFTDDNLAQYATVVFMNASGDLLDDTQQGAFERYIQAGGGYVGVHCASCGEDEWAWYGDLVGARFSGHPGIQPITINVEDQTHPSTAHLPAVWIWDEEPYNFATNPRPNVTVLATFDESSYEGGSMGDDHPIIWCHEFDGGRSWYTGLGHMASGYSDEAFIQLILGAVQWTAHRK